MSKRIRHVDKKIADVASDDQLNASVERALTDKDEREQENSRLNRYYNVAIVSLFLLLQAVLSSGAYSGAKTPPMYGDYEAQRHWMEITINLPPSEWYHNTTLNNLNYWGLDYPPLTAYHSWAVGRIGSLFNANWFKLHTSHGHESPEHKCFMRISVIVTMILMYVPTIFDLHLITIAHHKALKQKAHYFFLTALCYPGLIYIDNGHFQYNHICLAFAIRAWLWLLKDHLALGSIFFVAALNFKQIALYYSLPVFVFILARCFTHSWRHGIVRVIQVGVVVLLSFAVLWAPFLSVKQMWQVLHRVFPMSRGLYEDKVASFWCVVSPIYKFSRWPIGLVAKMSVGIIILLSLPTLCLLLRRPSARNFGSSLFLCSLAFFLFSIQVHEKTILFIAIPAIWLMAEENHAMVWFVYASMVSMFPLCIKDDLANVFPLFVVFYAFMVIKLLPDASNLVKMLHVANATFTSLLALAMLIVRPPTRLPDVFSLAFAGYSFFVFVACFLYIYWRSFVLYWSAAERCNKQKAA